MSHDHRVNDLVLVKGELVLAEHGKALARLNRDLPLLRLNLAGRIFKKVDLPAPLAPIRP